MVLYLQRLVFRYYNINLFMNAIMDAWVRGKVLLWDVTQ